MNGSGSESISSQYSPPTNYTSSYPQQTSQSQPSQQYQTILHPPALSISPPFVQFYQQQQQQQQQAPTQGTLSPHALHSPSNPLMSTVMTPAFYAQSPASSTSQALNPQARQDKFQAAIKPLLRPDSFSGAGAVNSLVTLITEYGSQDVGSQSRLEVLTKIRDNAPNHYFRAWSENMTAIDVTREWLKAGATAKGDSPLVETIMPLLHVSRTYYRLQYCNNTHALDRFVDH